MQAYPAIFIFTVALLGSASISCSPSAVVSPRQPLVKAGYQQASEIKLSSSDRQKIGNKIWQNESGGTVAGLTHWNTGEEFPSMGIGHFIWYPRGFQGRWTESFPRFVAYVNQRMPESMPEWVLGSRHCPWPDKESFARDFNGPRLRELRYWLANNISLQTDYIIETSREALPNIMSAAPAQQRAVIKANYEKVSTTANGTYSLIDYVNFKGDGTNPTERYNRQGWGLMWVLIEMRDVPTGQAAASEFAAAAKRCLDRRITNSPASRGEKRWRAGWHNRCDTYASAF